MKSTALCVLCLSRTIASIFIISMMACLPEAVACRAPRQAQAPQSVKSQVAASTPTPLRPTINCLDPNDTEALRPEVEIKLGVITRKALSLEQPDYPPLLKSSRMSGTVAVEVVIDVIDGKVIWARAISGHTLLRLPSARAACKARFAPTKIDSPTIRAGGILTYSFPPVRNGRPTGSNKRTSAGRTRLR
jgi:outer membrane biosynthesis protein TonB